MSKKPIDKSALILNPDGSIYHLNLKPDELADTIILVGDPDRVPVVSQYFDQVDLQKRKREFVTHTGRLHGQRLSVVSTGIGTDNIDIVINECDALHNVDFDKRCVKDKVTSLRFLRLGTCGAITDNIAADSLVLSTAAIGFDGLMDFYKHTPSETETSLLSDVQKHFKSLAAFSNAYVTEANTHFAKSFEKHCVCGITLTCSGFYGPQYRTLRAPLVSENILDMAAHFSSKHGTITNVEMETAGIYALSSLLGHQACSISTVLDNGITGEVSKDINKAIDRMVQLGIRNCLTRND